MSLPDKPHFLHILGGGLCIVGLLWTGTLHAQPSSESGRSPAIEAQVREVSKSLRCAVCQSESVWESNAELAVQMRRIIRERLTRGESPDQIRAYFQSRYGDFILLKPRVTGLNILLWTAPFVLLLVGGMGLYRALTHWKAVSTTPNSPLEDIAERRVHEAVENFYQSHGKV